MDLLVQDVDAAVGIPDAPDTAYRVALFHFHCGSLDLAARECRALIQRLSGGGRFHARLFFKTNVLLVKSLFAMRNMEMEIALAFKEFLSRVMEMRKDPSTGRLITKNLFLRYVNKMVKICAPVFYLSVMETKKWFVSTINTLQRLDSYNFRLAWMLLEVRDDDDVKQILAPFGNIPRIRGILELYMEFLRGVRSSYSLPDNATLLEKYIHHAISIRRGELSLAETSGNLKPFRIEEYTDDATEILSTVSMLPYTLSAGEYETLMGMHIARARNWEKSVEVLENACRSFYNGNSFVYSQMGSIGIKGSELVGSRSFERISAALLLRKTYETFRAFLAFLDKHSIRERDQIDSVAAQYESLIKNKWPEIYRMMAAIKDADTEEEQQQLAEEALNTIRDIFNERDYQPSVLEIIDYCEILVAAARVHEAQEYLEMERVRHPESYELFVYTSRFYNRLGDTAEAMRYLGLSKKIIGGESKETYDLACDIQDTAANPVDGDFGSDLSSDELFVF